MGAAQSIEGCPADKFEVPYQGVGENIIVETKKGKVKGFRKKERGPVNFRGVPVAAPVSGSNRFKAPQPRDPWEGVHDGTVFGDAPTQTPSTGGAAVIGQKCGNDIGKMGDDCLNINIVSPDVTGSYPVMVFVHGGANKMGSNKGDFAAMVPTTDRFAEAGVVVCAIAYRVQMHGFLHLPKEPKATNLALRDVINGLQWVQDEIAAFGGDPSNVTLFGESSGGVNTTHVMCSPLAQGLYHHAIVQSGGNTGNVTAKEYEEHVFKDYEAALKPFLQKHGHAEVTASALESLSAQDVWDAGLQVNGSIEGTLGVAKVPDPFYCYIGDDVIPKNPTELAKEVSGKHLVWGCNACEPMFLINIMGGALAGTIAYRMVLPQYIRGAEGFTCLDEPEMPPGCLTEARNRLVQKHQARIDKETGTSSASWTGATANDGNIAALQQAWFLPPKSNGRWIQAIAENNDVFMYTLQLTPEECPTGNWHGLDLLLLCRPDDHQEDLYAGQGFGPAGRTAAVQKVGEDMVKAWTDLGKNGTPGEFGGVAWPQYPQQMVLGSAPVVTLSPIAPESEQAQIWSSTMDECGIHPRKGKDYVIGGEGSAGGMCCESRK